MTESLKLYDRQTATAKATPDADSRVDLSALEPGQRVPFVLLLEPGRSAAVSVVDADGGELLIPSGAGGDGHYPTPVLNSADGPFDFEAASDTDVTFTLARVKS